MAKKILFFYLTKYSGHYAAAVAVEEGLRSLDNNIQTLLIDSFSHTNPVLSKVTLKAYLAVLRTVPEVWEFLYDNPEFKESTKKIRELLNRGNSKKLQKVLLDFAPDAVICTQGFACGVMASWKRSMAGTHLANIKLIAVLTDYVAHRYWGDPQVDLYIAPSPDTGQALQAQGVDPSRIRTPGMPVHHAFNRPVDRDTVIASLGLTPGLPKVLVMGGSLGLGPIKSVIRKLDRLPQPFDIVCITGSNDELKESLHRKTDKRRHLIKVMGFAENINELMEISEMIVTKPGGMTTTEALIKGLPMIIIKPIPGQEAKNTHFLLAHNVAVNAETTTQVANYVAEFFRNPSRLQEMRNASKALGRPNAAHDAAREILQLIGS
jgi:processive 1,2-diacylglycerol beta-glucosyltransferase